MHLDSRIDDALADSGRPVAFGGGTFTENTLVELIHSPAPPVALPEIRGS